MVPAEDETKKEEEMDGGGSGGWEVEEIGGRTPAKSRKVDESL